MLLSLLHLSLSYSLCLFLLQVHSWIFLCTEPVATIRWRWWWLRPKSSEICESRGGNIKYCTVSRHLLSNTETFFCPHQLLAPSSYSSSTFLSVSFRTLYRHTELFWKCKCMCSKLPSVLSMLLWIRKLKSVFSSPVPAHSHRQLQRDELKVPSDGAGRAAASVQASSPAHVDSFLCFVCSLTRDAALQPPLCWSQYLDSGVCLTNPIKHLKSIELKAKSFSTSSLCVVFIL